MRPRQELLQRLRDHGGQRPPRRGGMRTDPRDERHRQLDGEHRGRGGHRNMSGPAGALHVAVRLPGRTAEPAGQLSRGVGCRHPRVQQVRGGVDPLGEHVTTSASATGRPTNRHVTNILLDMSHRRTDTPRQFDTPIAQRHLKAEVANCVGGVSGPPCGVPDTSRRTDPSGITPARSIARSSFNTPWSLTRSSDRFTASRTDETDTGLVVRAVVHAAGHGGAVIAGAPR